MAKYLLLYYSADNTRLPKSVKDVDNFYAYAMYKVEKYKTEAIKPDRHVKILKSIGYFPNKNTVKRVQRVCAPSYRPTRDKDNTLRIKVFERDDEILEFENDDAAKLYFEVSDKNQKY